MASFQPGHAAVSAEPNRGCLPLAEPSEPHSILSTYMSSMLETFFFSYTAPPPRPFEHQHFQSIGRGYCAEIFEYQDKRQVYKRAHTPYDLQLWNDYLHHTSVYLSICLYRPPLIDLLVPKPHSYIGQDQEKWWDEHRSKWPYLALGEPTDPRNGTHPTLPQYRARGSDNAVMPGRV